MTAAKGLPTRSVDMGKLKELFARHREIILYLVFGVGTTAVDFAVSLSLVYLLDVNLYVSKVIAWVCAVAFAYITNRIFVFKSENKGTKNVLIEAGEFVTGRLISLGVQELMMVVLYEGAKMREWVVLVLSSILVIILNYIFGKLLVFRKK